MPGKRIAEQEQAHIIAEHATGDTALFIAQRHGISEATVKRIIRRSRALVTTVDPQRKQVDIAEHLTGYLNDAFATLRLQVQHMGDRDWLSRQDAAALGVQHGILFDKCIRVVRAISRGPDASESGPDGPGTSSGP